MRLKGFIFDHVIGALFYLACILIAFSMLSVDIEIIYRLLSGQAQLWVIEVSEYILLIVTFLGATWVLKNEGHVIMDVLTNQLKPRSRTILNAITSILCAVICGVIVWYGTEVAVENFQKGTIFYKAIAFPRAPIISVIPLGSFLLLIQFIRRALSCFSDWTTLREKKQTTLETSN